LATLRTPTLVLQGTRDEFGTRDEIQGYTLSPQIEVRFVEDGDHSLAPRKKSSQRPGSGVLDPKAAFEWVVDAVAEHVKLRCRG
jgi:predicted alpha/beta-hydrolase family hydrolase